MKTKSTALFLCSTMLMTACSKTIKETNTIPVETQSKNNVSSPTASSKVDLLKTLLSSEAPNLALAEFLARAISKEHKSELMQLVSELSEEEALAIIKNVEEDNISVRSNYLFHGQSYSNDKRLLSDILLDSTSIKNHPFSIESQLTISTVAYLKSKNLNNIITTFDKRAAALAKELANEIAYDIGVNHPEVARRIEQDIRSANKMDIIESIKKAGPLVLKVDQYFKTSELNENEQYATLIGTILAGAIYDQVKDNRGFKNIVEQGKKVVRDIKKFETKAKEFSMLVNTLGKHVESTGKDISDLGDGIKGAREDIFKLYKDIKLGSKGPVDFESKKIVDFIYKRVIKGEEANTNGSNPSVLSKQVSFNENFKKTLNAASNLTNNLSNIVTTADKLAKLFKIKPSNDLMKVLDNAQKVNVVIQGVQSAMVGFASGGFVGALGALSSGPMMSLMAGGGGGDSAALEAINKKLDMVLENQQKIMEMQLETMNMIKDLALMVDIYHQREMAAIAELRDYSMISQEMAKAQLNKDIRSCERMINFQLSSVWKNMDFGKDAFYSINNLEVVNSRFNYSIQSLQDIRRILNSVEEDGFSKCQSGLAEAFGGNSYEENPIRSIYASNSDDNLFKFQRETYFPLLAALQEFGSNNNYDSLPLHLPSVHMKGVRYKVNHIRTNRSTSNGEIYELDQLLSVRNLERYLSHLIVLLPLLEVDKDVWFKSYQDVISTYLDNSNSGNNQNTRSHFFLKNALTMTQSAIAQESILAGEPIMYDLHYRFGNAILSNQECASVKVDKFPIPYNEEVPFFCSLRENKLLMKNFISYALSERISVGFVSLSQYEKAYRTGDKRALDSALNLQLTDERFEIIRTTAGEISEIVVKVPVRDLDGDGKTDKVNIKLPSPEAAADDKIQYSENMPRLLKMQDAVLNALEKVAPVKRDEQGKDILKLLLVNI